VDEHNHILSGALRAAGEHFQRIALVGTQLHDFFSSGRRLRRGPL
jgi:hypothetical protein